MCVVILKPAGTELPTEDTINKCWKANPDGAGMMFLESGKVRIKKGYMELQEFLNAYNEMGFTKDDYLVLHFRISTGGGVTAANTHPFPLSDDPVDLAGLDIICDQAMVHNGILGQAEGELSDTAVFVRDSLADPAVSGNLGSKGIQNLIADATRGSRVFIMSTSPELALRTGKWHKDKDSGLWFSNTTWKQPAQINRGFPVPTEKRFGWGRPLGWRNIPQGALPEDRDVPSFEDKHDPYEEDDVHEDGFPCNECVEGTMMFMDMKGKHEKWCCDMCDYVEWLTEDSIEDDENIVEACLYCGDMVTLYDGSTVILGQCPTCGKWYELGDDGEIYDINNAYAGTNQ